MKRILVVLSLTFLLINDANSSIQCYSCVGQSCSEVSSDTDIVTCSVDDFTTTTTTTTTVTTTTEATTTLLTTVTNEEDIIIVEYTTPQSEDIQFIDFTTPQSEDIQLVEFTTPESEDIQFVEFTTPAGIQPIAETLFNGTEGQLRVVQSPKNVLLRQRRNARNDDLLVCVTATYLENGDQLTYRGCSIRSEEGFCSTSVPASSVVSCESCSEDFCNSARSIATSLVVLCVSLSLYYIIV